MYQQAREKTILNAKNKQKKKSDGSILPEGPLCYLLTSAESFNTFCPPGAECEVGVTECVTFFFC